MAKGIITVHAGQWNYSRWQSRFIEHLEQDNVKIAVHQIYAEMSEKYVPYGKTGALANSVRITKDYVRWGGASYNVPYAHYMYEGIVYGRNFYMKRGGRIIRWYSLPGVPKYPTGRRIIYNHSIHPLAQAHWDLAVYRNEMAGFKWRVTRELKKIANEEGW